ncbi:MAG: peptide chain release factor N(5)-glutamine methyltransferase [Clostridia bacterium]|nr:peptide chain release factor N(5)-glutamine methyltransferase [Clostridia bacterium]
MTIKQVLLKGKEKLKENDVEDESLISRLLLSKILGIRKEELIINLESEVDKEKEKQFFEGIEKIILDYPIQYITAHKEFMKMNFYVNESVLIPRADTEVLVEEVIKICKEENKKEILDMCTGSGAIAISIAKNLENTNITAVDISKEAIGVARINAKELLKENNIKFIKSNMFENVDKKFDVIVSNPPYIKTKEIDEYKLKYEPRLALDGGEDGLKFYKIIINEGYKYLKTNGIIVLEIGYDQKEALQKLVNENNYYKESYCIQDLCGNDRVIIIK